ncbi:secreted Ly-6/uPAR-related protein 1-like [Dendropsophus ebraccatus]|uniref:secreted Ly-6/uPAR-related protein 1-like n=1 Tax=Dendropsophus ebraccatus TaxID=150705 RepID=UPI003831CF9E
MRRYTIVCLLAVTVAVDVAQSFQCYFCYEASEVQNCNQVKDCPATAKGCKTMTVSPNTGYPFVSGQELVTRDCADKCYQTDNDALGLQNQLFCCEGNLCNKLYEIVANLSTTTTTTTSDSPTVMVGGLYRGLIPCLALLTLLLLLL